MNDTHLARLTRISEIIRDLDATLARFAKIPDLDDDEVLICTAALTASRRAQLLDGARCFYESAREEAFRLVDAILDGDATEERLARRALAVTRNGAIHYERQVVAGRDDDAVEAAALLSTISEYLRAVLNQRRGHLSPRRRRRAAHIVSRVSRLASDLNSGLAVGLDDIERAVEDGDKLLAAMCSR